MQSRFLIFFLMILLSAKPLFAQQPPPRPSANLDAGVTGERITAEATKKLEAKKRVKPVIEEPAEEKRPEIKSDMKFFVKKIVLAGNKELSTEELRPVITPYENRELTLREADQLAAKITAEYRKWGYITTLVYVPPQKITDGILTIQVLEGKMGKLHIEGNRWFSTRQIRRDWILKEYQPLKYDEIVKSLRRINGNPDRSAQVILKAGEEAGTTDVYLKVKDHFPGHLGFSWDNQGIPSTGQKRFGFTARYNNFLVPDAVFMAGTVFGRDFGAQFYQYLTPITPWGTKLIFSFSNSQVAPKREFTSYDIHGHSETYSMDLRHDLWQNDHFSANAHLGFDFKDSRTKNIFGTARRDRLRVLRAGFDVRENDRWGTTSFSPEVAFGIRGLGATSEHNPVSSRPGAEPNFVKFTGDLNRSVRMPFDTQLSLNFNYQFTTADLIPQEQFYLGGASTVRGYPEGDYLGDNGVLLNVEYLTPLPFVPEEWQLPYSDIPLRRQVQLVFFYDQGYGRLRSMISNEPKSRDMIGVGGGLRIYLYKNIYARLELAHVIGDEPLTESEHTRFHFRIQADI